MGAGGNRNKWPRRVKKKKNNKGAHSFQWAQEQQISPELAKQWVKLAVLAQEAEDLAQQRSCEEEELAKTQVWDHLIDVLEMAYPLALDCVNLINSYLPPSHQLDFIPPEEEAWTKEEFVQKFEDLMSFTYLARHLPDAAPAAVPQTLDDIRGDEDPRMEVDITLCDLYMYSSIGPRFPQGYDLEAVSSRVEHLAGEYPVRGEFEVLQYGYTAQYTPSSWDGIRNFVADRYTDFTNNIYVKSIFHKHGSRTEKVPLCYKGPVGPLLVLVHNFESTIPIKFTAMRALFNCLHDLRGKATRAIESLLTFNMQADELELYTLALCANEASDDPDAVRHETAMDKKVKMIISNIAASQALASGSSKAAVLPAEQAAGHSPLDEKQAPTAPIVVAQPVTKKRGQQDVLHLQPLPDVSMNAEKGVYTLDENILYSAGGPNLMFATSRKIGSKQENNQTMYALRNTSLNQWVDIPAEESRKALLENAFKKAEESEASGAYVDVVYRGNLPGSADFLQGVTAAIEKSKTKAGRLSLSGPPETVTNAKKPKMTPPETVTNAKNP